MPAVGTFAKWVGAGAAALVLGCVPAVAGAQVDLRQSLVDVSVTPESVTVGERFTIRVRVRAAKVATIRFPDVPPAADGVDPVDPRAIEDGLPAEMIDRTAVYTFVAWDTGRRGPILGAVVVSVAGRERSFPVGTPTVVVRSLLPADTAQQVPREAKAPVPLPSGRWRYLLLAGLLAAGLLWYLRNRHALRHEAEAAELPDAWQEARKTFAALEKMGLAGAGEPGRHVIAHVDVLRMYLSARIPSVNPAMGAAEVAEALRQADLTVPAERVAALLARDAELRFAHLAVGTDESAVLATEARDITALIQLAHEARLRAMERPPRPRRR